ncbi:MAG: hypothetical protein OHK0017_10230 [Patescibacteria group bacterium]
MLYGKSVRELSRLIDNQATLLTGMVLVVVSMYLLPLQWFVFGLRVTYYPIILFWAYLFLISKSSDNNFSYFKWVAMSLQKNMLFVLPWLIIFGILYAKQWYPQGNFNMRGIPYPLFPVLYALISVPIQQSLIFGEILFRLKHYYNATIAIILTALFYSGIHIYYPDPVIIIVSTFGMGIYWARTTIQNNSIIGNMVAHIIIGLLAFSLNLA